MKPVVLLDVDGVIADFTAAYTQIAADVVGRPLPSVENLTEWRLSAALKLTDRERSHVEQHLYRPGVAQSIRPYWNAVENVKRLASICDLVFVTSPIEVSPTWVYDRQQWIIKHFGMDMARVIHTYYKEYVFGHVLVDDKPSNISKWCNMQCGGTEKVGLLWDQSYNRVEVAPETADMQRVKDWNQVVDEVNVVKEALS